MKWKGYLVFILLSFVAACSQRNGLTPARSDQVSEARSSYFPLSDGAEWVYAAQYFAPAAGVQKGKVVVRVDGTEIINGKTYSRLVTLFSGIPGAMDLTDYYRTDKEGIYIVHGREKNSAEQLYLPFPIEVGKSWTVKGPDGLFRYQVEGMETAHLIEKKYERCFKITVEGTQQIENPDLFGPRETHLSGVTLRAPGIGEVKSNMKLSRGEMKASIDLALENYKQ